MAAWLESRVGVAAWWGSSVGVGERDGGAVLVWASAVGEQRAGRGGAVERICQAASGRKRALAVATKCTFYERQPERLSS